MVYQNPHSTEAPQPTVRCEYYSRAVHNAIFLRGEWIPQAGFSDGMPVKIRVMPDCIVITTRKPRELWGCAEGLSVAHVKQPKMNQWLKLFPGALNDTGAQARGQAFWVKVAADDKIPARAI